jgi:hypothetical protein
MEAALRATAEEQRRAQEAAIQAHEERRARERDEHARVRAQALASERERSARLVAVAIEPAVSRDEGPLPPPRPKPTRPPEMSASVEYRSCEGRVWPLHRSRPEIHFRVEPGVRHALRVLERCGAVRGEGVVFFCAECGDTDSCHCATRCARVLILPNGVDGAAPSEAAWHQPVVPAVAHVTSAMPDPGCAKHFRGDEFVIAPCDAALTQGEARRRRNHDVVDLFAAAAPNACRAT